VNIIQRIFRIADLQSLLRSDAPATTPPFMRKVLLEELRLTRKCVADGAIAEAQRHIGVALRLYEATPIGAIPPQVGNVIMWAERAMEGAEVAVVLMALDEAMRVLEEG
jgi:hypothetical protein